MPPTDNSLLSPRLKFNLNYVTEVYHYKEAPVADLEKFQPKKITRRISPTHLNQYQGSNKYFIKIY